MAVEEDMKLPEGKTCGDCDAHPRCKALFGCPVTNTTCDWSPSRFRLRVVKDEPWDGLDGPCCD